MKIDQQQKKTVAKMKYGLGYSVITGTTGFLARTILHFRRTELNYIINSLKNRDNLKILDYGCNTGYFLDMIKNKYPLKNFELCGADINNYALNYARNNYKNYTFFDINNEFYDGEKFDIIIVSHVLEHVHDRNTFIANLKKLLRKNGTMLIAIPQERIRGDCTPIQLFYNFARFRFENPHVVNMKLQELDELVSKNNLQINDHVFTHFLYPFKSGKKRFDSWSLIAEIAQKKKNELKNTSPFPCPPVRPDGYFSALSPKANS